MEISANSSLKRICRIVLCFVIAAGLVLPSAPTAGAVSFTKNKPKGLMATAVKQKASITWEPVSGADWYAVYDSVAGGGFKVVKRTKK